MVKIYTKTGDKGETSLFTGERVPKYHDNIKTLGDIDECNSAIGAAASFINADAKFAIIKQQLNWIQNALFDLGAAVATPRTRAVTKKLDKTRFDHASITLLEEWIDKHEHELPPLKNFILPSGHPAGAMIHLARTICRRAERHAVSLFMTGDITEDVLVYLNRLSDYLFVLARRVNALSGSQEQTWQPHKEFQEVLPNGHAP